MLLNTLVLAILLGWLLGGRLRRLSQLQLVYSEVLIGSFVLQALLPFLPHAFRFVLLILSYVLILGVLFVNRRTAGILFAASGVLLNLVVILANGGMPVSVEMVRALGGGKPVFNDGVHVALTPNSRLAWLADIWRDPLPPGQGLISLGDVLLSIGVCQLVITNMRYVGRRRKAPK